MAALSAQASPGRLRDTFLQLMRAPSQLVFAQRVGVTCLMALAIACEPRGLVFGLCALLGAGIASHQLKVPVTGVYVPYGYNALLVGLALARDIAPDAVSLTLAVSLGALSVLATAALASLSGYLGFLPLLSAPFVVTTWLAAGVLPHLSVTGADAAVDALGQSLPLSLGVWLESIGAIVLVPKALAGLCVLSALLLHSRISSLLALLGSGAVLLLLHITHAPLAQSTLVVIASNAALTAVAIGGVWLVPSRSSFALALAASLFTGFFALGSIAPLARLGIEPWFLPFNTVALIAIAALRQRAHNRAPVLAGFAADSPEQLLLADVVQRTLHAEPTAVPMALPFGGVWSCTQGVDGAYTHRGVLRHAFDFEVYGGPEGSLCSGDGESLEDFHCYGLPVLASADGTVVSIESGMPDNAVGDVQTEKPWGNHVIVQHAHALYSLSAHLKPGTIAVAIGQVVRRGEVLGRCGNSGRSPRPHLHFQLQQAPELGSITLPCRFTDVVVNRMGNRDERTHFEASHTPREGEGLRAMRADSFVAACFDLPLGHELTYRERDVVERVRVDLSDYGHYVLRSLEYETELFFVRGERGFALGELRGSTRSVLSLLRLCLPRVPFEADPSVAFRDLVPGRFVAGSLTSIAWDLTAPFRTRPGFERESNLRLDGSLLTVAGCSKRRSHGPPRLETRVVMQPGIGPTLLELHFAGTTRRAELVVRPLTVPNFRTAEPEPASDLELRIGNAS